MHRVRAIRRSVYLLAGQVVNSGRRLLLKVREKEWPCLSGCSSCLQSTGHHHNRHGYDLGVDTQQKSAFICAVTGSAGVLSNQIEEVGLIVGLPSKKVTLTGRFWTRIKKMGYIWAE